MISSMHLYYAFELIAARASGCTWQWSVTTPSCRRQIYVCSHQSPHDENQLFLSEVYQIWQNLAPRCAYCHKHQTHSRLYINFVREEDVIGFVEFFNGHVFVNEKGNQFKVQVKYAPSQQVLKPPKKDGRDGTIAKEIQLERRKADRVGKSRTPFLLQKKMKLITAGKVSRRSGAPSAGVPTSSSSKRGSEKKKLSPMGLEKFKHVQNFRT